MCLNYTIMTQKREKGNSFRKLLSPEREQLILTALRDGVRTITELAAELQVSEATVRRDLQSLEERSLVRRVHGGAIRISDRRTEPLFHEKASHHPADKAKIAERALEMIENGDSIYLDGGSTVLALVRHLKKRRDLTIVTNSLMAAAELMETGHRLILLGGEFRPISRTLVGPLTAPVGEALNIGKAFFGTIGLTQEGLSTTDPNEAYTKMLIMRRAAQSILLSDSTKFGHASLTASGSLELLDTVITDKAVPHEFVTMLKKRKIEVITV